MQRINCDGCRAAHSMHTGSCHVAERGDGGCLLVTRCRLTEEEERSMGGEGR